MQMDKLKFTKDLVKIIQLVSTEGGLASRSPQCHLSSPDLSLVLFLRQN